MMLLLLGPGTWDLGPGGWGGASEDDSNSNNSKLGRRMHPSIIHHLVGSFLLQTCIYSILSSE